MQICPRLHYGTWCEHVFDFFRIENLSSNLPYYGPSTWDIMMTFELFGALQEKSQMHRII